MNFKEYIIESSMPTTLLNESSSVTPEQAYEWTEQFDNGKYIQNAKSVHLLNVDVILTPGVRTLRAKAESQTRRFPYIEFYNVMFTDTEGEGYTKQIRTASNKIYYLQPMDFDKQKIAVRCTCPDFYFTGSFWLKQKGALAFTRRKTYRRKTTWWPPRNPQHIPTLCKHLVALFNMMSHNNFFQ